MRHVGYPDGDPKLGDHHRAVPIDDFRDRHERTVAGYLDGHPMGLTLIVARRYSVHRRGDLKKNPAISQGHAVVAHCVALTMLCSPS